MKEERETVRNRAIRLLEEMRADHAVVSGELRDRLAILEQHHETHSVGLKSHRDMLSVQGETLNEVRLGLANLSERQEKQLAMLSQQASRLESLDEILQKIPPSRSWRGGFSSNQPPLRKDTTMTDTMRDDDRGMDHGQQQLEDWRSVSWSAIIFGAMSALAISAMLHVLGLGVTANAVDTSNRANEALSLIGGVAGIWFLVSTAIALFIGGFVASSLAHTFTGKRAAIYGIGVWALTTLVTTAVVVPSLVNGMGNALNTAGTIVDRAGAVLGVAGNGAAQAGQNAPSGLVDRFRQTLIGNPQGQVDQGAVQDIVSLVGQRLTQDQWTSEQHDRLVGDVARVANISPEDARRRVDEVQNTINTTIQQAQQKLQQAAEVARQAIATAAYSIFAAMLIGLLAAFFGARYGELDEDQLPVFARIRTGSATRSY